MKTKEEILKMTKGELDKYKWSGDLDLTKKNKDYFDCSNCSNCSNCSVCFRCYDCSNCFCCFNCRNASRLMYAICNVEVGKEAFEAKMKELGT